MKRWSTVQDFIANGKLPPNETVAAFEGFASKGDGGASLWLVTGATGTPSQPPIQRGDNLLTDTTGAVFKPQLGSVFYFDGTNQWFPSPFGDNGNGIYQYNGAGWNYYEQAGGAVPIAVTTGLITNAFNYEVGTALSFTGYSSPGDGGSAQWIKTSETGSQSQSPALRGDGTLTDATGAVWEIVSSGTIDVSQLGFIPNGADDTDQLNALSMIVSQGGDYTLSKEYEVQSRWRISNGSGFKLRFIGGGKVTRIGGTSTVFEVTDSNNFELFSPVIDGGGAGGNHGIVISDCNDSRVYNPIVTNHTNTGILVFGTVSDTYARNYIFNPVIDGLGVANNGILIGDLNDSHTYNASVKGCAGSPGIGLQLKNECSNCSITGIVENCFVGLGFGRESVTGVQNSKASAIVMGCTAGFQASGASGNSVDVKIDMLGSGENAIDWQQNCNNNYTAAEVQNMAASKSVVRLSGDAGVLQDNIVDLNNIKDISSSAIANFGSTATRNTVNIKKWNADPAVVDGVMSRVIDTSSAGSNTINYSDQTVYINEAISAGVVAIQNRGVKLLIVDTEASAATGDLDSITGTFYDGDTLMVRSQSNVRDVTVKHGVGNILLNGSADFVLSGVADSLLLMYNANISSWTQLSGNNVT